MSLPPHVGRKISFNGWYSEDGKGNSQQMNLSHKNTPKSYTPIDSIPSPVEPQWKPSEPQYTFPLF